MYWKLNFTKVEFQMRASALNKFGRWLFRKITLETVLNITKQPRRKSKSIDISIIRIESQYS